MIFGGQLFGTEMFQTFVGFVRFACWLPSSGRGDNKTFQTVTHKIRLHTTCETHTDGTHWMVLLLGLELALSKAHNP